jgi:hypothetical protein
MYEDTVQNRLSNTLARLHPSAEPRTHMELAADLQHTALTAHRPPTGSLLDAFR